MPQPAEVERRARELIALFAEAQASLEAQIAAAATDGQRARYRELLRAVEADMAALRADAAGWLEGNLADIYALGATDADPGFAWSQTDVQAVQELADSTFADILSKTGFVEADVKAWVREEGRRATRAAVMEGKTAQQAARDMARALEDRGVGRITYANGRRVTLDDYADMLVRTRSAEAYNEGTLNTLAGAGVEFVEVLDGGDCGWTSHDDGDKANGTVRSLDDCRQQQLSHPRCRRSFFGRPDVRSGDEAITATPSTTAEQRADQYAAEQEREQANRARAARAKREARSPRAARSARAPRD